MAKTIITGSDITLMAERPSSGGAYDIQSALEELCEQIIDARLPALVIGDEIEDLLPGLVYDAVAKQLKEVIERTLPRLIAKELEKLVHNEAYRAFKQILNDAKQAVIDKAEITMPNLQSRADAVAAFEELLQRGKQSAIFEANSLANGGVRIKDAF